jgi:hypothetical protein
LIIAVAKGKALEGQQADTELVAHRFYSFGWITSEKPTSEY